MSQAGNKQSNEQLIQQPTISLTPQATNNHQEAAYPNSLSQQEPRTQQIQHNDPPKQFIGSIHMSKQQPQIMAKSPYQQSPVINNMKESDQPQDKETQKKRTLQNQIQTLKDQPVITEQTKPKQTPSEVQKQSQSIPLELTHKKDKENVQQRARGQRQSLKIPQHKVVNNSSEHSQSSDRKEKELAISKRSDESQFVNWEINTIRSGQFGFDKKNTLDFSSKKPEKETQPINIKRNFLSIELLPKSLVERDNFQKNDLKVKKCKSKQHLQTSDMNLKLIKQIFCHFCKENSLSSIRSTLFEDKSKAMEEMCLHKWMVFCKEFDLLQKLKYLKFKSRLPEGSLQTSKVSEQRKVKEMKQTQAFFTSIFKRASENQQKMQFVNFLKALQDLFSQFQSHSEEGSLRNIFDFAKIHLHCSSEKQCFHKLSHLKYIFATPQISYDKVYLDKTKIQKSLEQSKAKLQVLKEPVRPTVSKHPSSYSQKHLTKNINRLEMNPIIRQAKNNILLGNRAPKNSILNPTPKNKTKSYQPKPLKLPQAKEEQNALYEYFDSTSDAILDNYFKNEKSVLGAVVAVRR